MADSTPALSRSTKIIRTFVSDWGEELEEVACPVCEATDAKFVLKSRDALYGKPGSYPLVRCASCSLVYVQTRPTPRALGPHYPDDYFCYKAPEDEHPWLRRAAESSARDCAKGRVLRLEHAMGQHVQPDTRLIDIGCGLNDFLQMVREQRGAVGTGIDMNERMVRRIRERLEMPAIQGTLLDAGLPDGELDVVSMHEYLEHEPDPLRVLAESRRVLKTGGHVAIEIPHYGGLPSRLFKSRWSNLDLPRHLVFFEPDTLRKTLASQGFEMISYQTFTLPFHFGISLVFVLGGLGLGRNPIAPWLAVALGWPFLPFQRWLPEFGLAVARAV
ncbi:MAG TPA: methyltransferase domain-containing protein [Polyangiales bacterium]|nr:methyltransferase domain-containing protein [Polyangiales bacterium]